MKTRSFSELCHQKVFYLQKTLKLINKQTNKNNNMQEIYVGIYDLLQNLLVTGVNSSAHFVALCFLLSLKLNEFASLQ